MTIVPRFRFHNAVLQGRVYESSDNARTFYCQREDRTLTLAEMIAAGAQLYVWDQEAPHGPSNVKFVPGTGQGD